MNIVALTGAGISKESGLETFRDSKDGLWAGYKIEEVCTPSAWLNSPQKVLDFYNKRRREVLGAKPNSAHDALVRLEAEHNVTIITQNVDDLHTRAGSSNVIHLHGEVLKARSEEDETAIVDWRSDLALGDLAPDGEQLRPHIVFFHEIPFRMEEARDAVRSSDVFLVIGTSLNVYPAAGLVDYARREVIVIDPHRPAMSVAHYGRPVAEFVQEPATVGVPQIVERLMARQASA